MNEQVLDELIKECVRDALAEYHTKDKTLVEEGVLYEMPTRANGDEFHPKYPFHYQKYHINVYGSDDKSGRIEHNPPHAHVSVPKEGYEVTYRLDDGSPYQEKIGGSMRKPCHRDIKRWFVKWLKMRNQTDKTMTNQEYCMKLWEENNPNRPIVWNV